jgi:hypothetical protein
MERMKTYLQIRQALFLRKSNIGSTLASGIEWSHDDLRGRGAGDNQLLFQSL